MAKSLGQYKGVTLYEGEDLAARMRQIDAQQSTSSSGNTANDPAFKYGAAGRGEFEKENAKITKEATSRGVPMSEIGDYENDPTYKIPKSAIPRVHYLTKEEGAGVAQNYGLQGIDDPNEYAGLTRAQADAKAAAKQAKLKSQISLNTSYAFNPETIAGFNSKFKDLKFKVDDINNDPWSNKNEKKNKTQALVNSYTDQFAGLFGSQEEFNAAMTSDSNFQTTIGDYTRMGGDVNAIASKIAKPVTTMPDGSIPSPYGVATGPQTLDQYLGNISTPSEKKAYDSLLPEKGVFQAEIAFQQSIPEKYKDLYFGTPEQVGLVQQKRKQAEEQVKILERQAKLDAKNVKAQANFAIEKNNAQLDIEENRIEENRLAAKNYMTGMLAKLGALNTTGAAPLALTTLEQKYQKQASELRTNYDMSNKEITLRLNENVDSIGIDRDNNILKVKSDLSKNEEDIWKEIFKLQNDADSKTLNIVEKYTIDFQQQRDKYIKEAEAAAEKDLKARQKIISSYKADGILPNPSSSNADFDAFVSAQEKAHGIFRSILPSAAVELYMKPYMKYLASSGKVSADLKAVLSGDKLSSYTPTIQTKIKREAAALGIPVTSLGEGDKGSVPEVGDLLKQAEDAIAGGKDKEAVRKKFLQAYPEKSAAWNAYFNE